MSESRTSSDKAVIIGIGLTHESAYVLSKSVGLLGNPDRVIAVHVLERSALANIAEAEAIALAQDAHSEMRSSAERDLAAMCEAANVKKYEVLEGNPAAQLQAMARKHDARAIVVGSHGFHGWRAFLGETANSVLHGSPCDVHAIMSRDHSSNPSTEYRRIVVAIDMTESAATVIETALRIQKRYGAQIELLTVVRPIRAAYPGLDAAATFDPAVTLEQEAESHYKHQLAAQASKYGIENYEVRRGELAEEIHRKVSDGDVDLVVMGLHARKGIRLFSGTAPNDVLHGLTCDLYAVLI